ncbi:hypothetical protein BC829DRAFT_395010 [Chytridium lagenaria]|nr:hypothetical protein BC829DRAFT_395010 [Chytridium lagenaria]
MKVGITAAFKLGLLDIRTLPLERVINVGELLLASGFLSPTPTSGSSSSSTEAAVSVSPLPISLLSNGAIASGLKLGIPPPGSPVGIHLRNVVFDLVLDQNTLAKCFIPRLDVTAGDLDMTIPLNITVNTLGSINALFAQVNIFSGQKNLGMKSVSALNENGQRVAWLDRGLERVHFKVPLDRLRSAVSAVLTKWILDLLSASSRRS